MDTMMNAMEQVSLFCRLNMNTRRNLPIRSSEMGMLIYLVKADGEKTAKGDKSDGYQYELCAAEKRLS